MDARGRLEAALFFLFFDDVGEAFFGEGDLFVAGAFAHDDHVDHGVDEGQAGEGRAGAPVDDENDGSLDEVVIEQSGAPDEQAEAQDQKKCAKPSAPRVERREHGGNVALIVPFSTWKWRNYA